MRTSVLIASIVMAGTIGMLALITLYVLPLQAGAVYSVGMAVTWIAGDHVRRSTLRTLRASAPRTAARRTLRGTLRPAPQAARPTVQVTDEQ